MLYHSDAWNQNKKITQSAQKIAARGRLDVDITPYGGLVICLRSPLCGVAGGVNASGYASSLEVPLGGYKDYAAWRSNGTLLLWHSVAAWQLHT